MALMIKKLIANIHANLCDSSDGGCPPEEPLAVSHQSCSLKTDIAENPSEPELN